MPLLTLPYGTCYYRLTGGDDRPVLILAHSLGQDHGLWDPQMPDLQRHFRVLRYDIRGHGASAAPPGDYRIDDLGADALALADALHIDRFAWCGVSLGGMIGMWLAAFAPDRVTAAILANTSARPGAEAMETRRRTVLSQGMAPVVDAALARSFSLETVAARPLAVENTVRTLTSTDPVGYAGCCATIRDLDLTAALRGIRVPVLVIGGERDVAMPWQGHGDVLAREIPGVVVRHLPAAHLSNLEAPRSFTASMLEFLLPSSPATGDDAERVRRQVLGDDHVDRALAAAAEGSAAFQDLVTRHAWGTIWTRPGLDFRTRRLLVLAMTAAMGRWEEFRLHVRTGLARELEWCDLEEALLQTAVYAGLPAANTAFHIAGEERRRARGGPPPSATVQADSAGVPATRSEEGGD